MKEYKKILGNNNYIQNQLALALLLEKGKTNILNDNFYNEMLKSVEKKPSSFMSIDFQKEYIKIARDMAKMKTNDLYDYIKNEVVIPKNKERGRE